MCYSLLSKGQDIPHDLTCTLLRNSSELVTSSLSLSTARRIPAKPLRCPRLRFHRGGWALSASGAVLLAGLTIGANSKRRLCHPDSNCSAHGRRRSNIVVISNAGGCGGSGGSGAGGRGGDGRGGPAHHGGCGGGSWVVKAVAVGCSMAGGGGGGAGCTCALRHERHPHRRNRMHSSETGGVCAQRFSS